MDFELNTADLIDVFGNKKKVEVEKKAPPPPKKKLVRLVRDWTGTSFCDDTLHRCIVVRVLGSLLLPQSPHFIERGRQ